MTVSSTISKAGPYAGNGVTTAFPFAFKIFTKADVQVVRATTAGVETILVLDSDYSVSVNTNQTSNPGGTITYPISGAPLSAILTLTASGNVSYTQGTSLPVGGAFNAAVVEAALDRVTLLTQQLLEQVSRAVKVSISSGIDPAAYLTSIAAAVTAVNAAAGAAGTSATNAATSEGNALSYKNTAGTSATNAATSEGNALSSKNAAGTSATNAATSEGNALASKNAAGTSATNAATSEGNALSSKNAAQQYLETLVQPFSFYKTDYDTVCFSKTAAGALSIKAGTVVVIAGVAKLFSTLTAVTMPTLVAGSDYSVWVKTDGTAVAVIDPYSSPATAPATGAKKIGGFHYGLVAPSTTPAGGSFATTGFSTTGGNMVWAQGDVDKIAGINQFSLWDLALCCAGDQRGMALDPQTRAWLGIYFCSTNHIGNGVSAYNTNVASGTVLPLIPLVYGGSGSSTYGQMSHYESVEIAASHGLRLPTYPEFMSAMFGVTEGQSLGGASSTIPATARQPGYTSRLGIEQATGHQYAAGPFHSVGGSAWAGVGRGSFYGTSGYALFGGDRDGASVSGSRTAVFHGSPLVSHWYVSLRAAGDLKKTTGPALYSGG